MKPKLILFTDGFPFGSGETFIENELPYLESAFDLTIVASSQSVEMTRQVGKDTRVISVEKTAPSRLKLLSAMAFLLFSTKAKEERRGIARAERHARKSLRRQSALAYARSKNLYKAPALQSVWTDGSCVLYFYWNTYKPVYFLLHRQKFQNLKMISRIHGYDLYNERVKTGRQSWKYLNNRLDKLFFLSESAREYYRGHFDPCVDTYSAIARLGVKGADAVAAEISREEFLLCSCSRVVAVKRLDRVVDALCEIRDMHIKWVHLGDGEDLEKLKEYTAQKLGGNDNISVEFCGSVKNEDVMKYYVRQAPDAYILTSESEGVPVSVMEALSCGLPVIASDVGGVPEMLEGAHNIILKNADNPEEIAAAIQKIYGRNDVQKRQEAALNRNLWNERYNAPKNYSDFCEDICKL